MFCDVGLRLGVVESCEVMSLGSEAWNAFRQLIVRGMPLKLMHLRPTSLMNSAVLTPSPFCDATP